MRTRFIIKSFFAFVTFFFGLLCAVAFIDGDLVSNLLIKAACVLLWGFCAILANSADRDLHTIRQEIKNRK